MGMTAAGLAALLIQLTANDVGDLVRRLGDDDVETREEASRRLAAAGRPHLALLRQARRTTSDPEVETRLDLLLFHLDEWYAEVELLPPEAISKAVSIDFVPGRRTPIWTLRDLDGSRVAFGLRESPSFETVTPPVVSADGSSHAFAGRRAQGDVIVHDGVETPVPDGLHAGRLVALSPDGKRVAHVAYDSAGQYVVVDGVKGPAWPKVDHLTIASNGDAAYAAEDVKGWRVVAGGREGPVYADVGPPAFSADGRHVAHRAHRDGKSCIVVDGSEGPLHDFVGPPAFAPASNDIAYVGRDGRKMVAIVGDRVSEPYDHIDPLVPPAVSADGKHVAFAARDGRESFVVVDGCRGEAFDFVEPPVFAPKGGRVAFIARSGPGISDNAVCENEEWYVVIDGAKRGPYRPVFHLTWSADGDKVGFVTREGGSLWWRLLDAR